MKKHFILFFLTLLSYLNAQRILENIPEKLLAGSSHIVEVTLERPESSSGFAKLYMDVFSGIQVEEYDSKGGVFAFEPTQSRAKIVWINAPELTSYQVKFKILVAPTAKGKGKIFFTFSYISGDEKKEIKTSSRSIQIEEDQGQVRNSSSGEIAPSGEKKETSSSLTSKNNPEPSAFPPSSPTKVKTEFKIQLSASSSRPDLSSYKHLGKVSVYEEQGMYKIMLGNYTTKNEAREKLDELQKKGYSGFIVTFENGIKK